MCGRIVGVQFNSMLELPIRPSEIEVVREQRLRARALASLGGAAKLRCLLDASLGWGKPTLGSGRPETREQRVGLPHPGKDKRLARFFRHRLIEVVDRFAELC